MSPATGASRSLSATDAARDALDIVKSRLFPFQFDRWFALGFVAFLDQCGRNGGSFNYHQGNGYSGSEGRSPIADDLSTAGDWIAAHFGLLIALAVLALVLVVALTALILW